LLTSLKASLNSVARTYLQAIDYRVYGVLIALIVIIFVFWRRKRYDSWPSAEQCLILAFNLAASIGGITVGLVFLATNPPAVDLLPTNLLMIIGLVVPIIVFGYSFPKIRALFLPAPVPKPVENAVLNTAEESGTPRDVELRASGRKAEG
jgi:ABC-type xylose transport system permease subunit